MKSPELLFEEQVRRALEIVDSKAADPSIALDTLRRAAIAVIRHAVARLDSQREDIEAGDAAERIGRENEVPWGET